MFSRPPYIMGMLYTYRKFIFLGLLASRLQLVELSPCSCYPAFLVLISVCGDEKNSFSYVKATHTRYIYSGKMNIGLQVPGNSGAHGMFGYGR